MFAMIRDNCRIPGAEQRCNAGKVDRQAKLLVFGLNVMYWVLTEEA